MSHSKHSTFISSNSIHGSSSHQQNDRFRSIEASNMSASMEDSQMGLDAAAPPDMQEDEDQTHALFNDLFARSEAKLAYIFGTKRKREEFEEEQINAQEAQSSIESGAQEPIKELAPKKAARTIVEDDYDDDEDEEEDSHDSPSAKGKAVGPLLSPSKSGSSPIRSDSFPPKLPSKESDKETSSQSKPQTAEEIRKQLEEAKKATEDAVKRSFSTMIYTLENDRIAMLEQQKLEDSEKQIDADLDHTSGPPGANGESHGTLSSANLGASSLTLKHLIARIDFKRDRVKASDAELRSLMNEVRKNRSKWASEENVGQEELYESAEKVLSELKAMTEYSAPFLTRVNKREAPDYYNIIKVPMDLGTMTKKLKTLVYKSKVEFTADLELIWANCLKYNADMAHPLRRNANAMRKEAEKLIPLIPDIVIRPRAEVEAEERRKQNGGGDDADDSDDEPIMSSRGRKAPGKTGAKGASTIGRKAVPGREDTPNEQKPVLPLNGLLGVNNDGTEFGREGSSNGFATPPVGGSATPGGAFAGSQADAMDIDGPSINGLSLGQMLGAAAEDLQEDEEYKIWKQVTKKDRALVAKERNKLFKGDKLNADEPALLRSKAGMRRFLRQQKQAEIESAGGEAKMEAEGTEKPNTQAVETLAEGMEGEEERVIPDYYDSLSAIPDIPSHMRWIEDDKGQVIDQTPEEFLRMLPKGMFTAPQSALTSRIEANMRQMQETRKICSKIGVVKQMQLQSQMYNNQFQKYNPEPFVEEDIEPHVVSDDGPIMSPWVCRAALQRSVGKLCYHAGFEELQPSALDVITDLAADYFQKIAQTLSVYREVPKVPATGLAAEAGQKWQHRFSSEEALLHCLSENGLEVESLESYARDENERLGTKLSVMHERMKAHLTDLLRPALSGDAGVDGVGAFNDGSEQFVGGDFAEDLDEDFFGFKELGLDKEFGLATLSVPLHLLQSKVHNAHQSNNQATGPTTSLLFEPLPPLEPVTVENIQDHIGMVKNFFLAKLHANNDEPLVEDEDLPTKQRFPKPRLPPTGKITSPRKRPLKEQQGNAKKKKKLENGQSMDVSPEKGKANSVSPEKGKKLKLPPPDLGSLKGMNGGPVGQPMQRDESQGGASTASGGKDDASAAGPLSPESIER